MENIQKLLKRPAKELSKSKGKFEKFHLIENPFPSEPFVNKDSDDNRINGKIYEMEIRKNEYLHFERNYLKIPQYSPTHLRMCYVIDKSYVGRGNGKTAFLVNLQDKINKEFCLDISQGENKCFAIYIRPEPGGRTKTFEKVLDMIFSSMLNSSIIEKSFAILKLQAITDIYPKFQIEKVFKNSQDIVKILNDEKWYKTNKLEISKILKHITKDKNLQSLPSDFPIYKRENLFQNDFPSQQDFEDYYVNLKKGKQKIEFIFSNLVSFFIAAGFNGAYIFIDDYERIPDFQSSRQKRDFSLELRSCLYDGLYLNSKIGFYIFVLALHAGVPRLVKDAWNDSGMENRAPMNAQPFSKHIIPFEKLSLEHARLLIKKYLSEFRIKGSKTRAELYPFSESSVKKIAELAELNASKILKMAYEILEKASCEKNIKEIDEQYVKNIVGKLVFEDTPPKTIAAMETTDLQKKASKRKS